MVNCYKYLVIWYTPKLSWWKTLQHLAHQRKLCFLYYGFVQKHKISYHHSQFLFTEIWGFEPVECLENVQLSFWMCMCEQCSCLTPVFNQRLRDGIFYYWRISLKIITSATLFNLNCIVFYVHKRHAADLLSLSYLDAWDMVRLQKHKGGPILQWWIESAKQTLNCHIIEDKKKKKNCMTVVCRTNYKKYLNNILTYNICVALSSVCKLAAYIHIGMKKVFNIE